jgi:hypothetical protein
MSFGFLESHEQDVLAQNLLKENEMREEKRVRVGIEEFMAAYYEAVNEGTTLDDFAASLKVAPLTVYQRVCKLRGLGVDIPHLSGGKKETAAEKAARIWAAYQNVEAEVEDDVEAEVEDDVEAEVEDDVEDDVEAEVEA